MLSFLRFEWSQIAENGPGIYENVLPSLLSHSSRMNLLRHIRSFFRMLLLFESWMNC